jgi:hypothetical protein
VPNYHLEDHWFVMLVYSAVMREPKRIFGIIQVRFSSRNLFLHILEWTFKEGVFRLFLVVILTLLIFGTGYDLYVEQPLHEHLIRKSHRRHKSREFEGFTYEQIHQMTVEDYTDSPRCESQKTSK